MPQSPAAVAESHLRRLDAAACRALVADLWAARGFDVTVEDRVVLAARGGRTLTILPLGRARLGAASPPDRPVDVVVAPGGVPRGVGDARVVDAAALREMLWYAVDTETRDRLCEAHLGAAPGDLRPPLSARVAGATRAAASLAPPVVVAVALLALLGGAGVPDVAPPGIGGTGAAAPGNATPAAVPESPTTTTTGPGRFPPGLSTAGIENLTALATAHDRALRGRSYTIWFDRYRPAGGNVSAPTVQRDMDLAVEGDRYLLVSSVEDADRRKVVRRVYYDGTDWFVNDELATAPSARYRRVPGNGTAPSVAPDPFRFREAVVYLYLSTPTTRYEGRTSEEGRTLYRVEGNGVPDAPGYRNVTDYRVAALVGPRGVVHSLRVEYERATPNGTIDVRFSATYDRFGTTTVDRPAWYGRAFAGNGTGTATPAWYRHAFAGNGTATGTTATATATPGTNASAPGGGDGSTAE